MLKFYQQLNCTFTDAEKEKCIPIILRMVELANCSRSVGISALEKEAEKEENFFLKQGILSITHAVDNEYIKEFLLTLIIADNRSGAELLSRLMITEGIISIQNGENPRHTAMKLTAMLGEKHMEEFLKKGTNYFREYEKKIVG